MEINKEYIEKLVDTIRKSLKCNEVFVDMEDVIKKLNGKITFDSTDELLKEEIGGVVKKCEEGFEIIMNKSNHDRFYLAELVGHLFFDMGYLINSVKWNESAMYTDSVFYRFGYIEEKNKANKFANCFLMPSDLFLQVMTEYKDGDTVAVDKVAERFGVSCHAVIERGKGLDLFPHWAETQH